MHAKNYFENKILSGLSKRLKKELYFFFQTQFLLKDTIMKNHTHVKKVEQTSEFVFWHLLISLRNKLLLKKLFKWANKNKIISIFTMLHFLK